MSGQECIPVGCVLPAALAVHGEVCLSACWDTQPTPGVGLETALGMGLETPWVWAWRPPRCGPGDPSDPSASPLGVGLESPLDTCKACWDTTCNACWDTSPPPLWTEFLTHASQNITLPQTSFAGGNKVIFVSNKYAFQ